MNTQDRDKKKEKGEMGKDWKRNHKTKQNGKLGRGQSRRGRAWADLLRVRGGCHSRGRKHPEFGF